MKQPRWSALPQASERGIMPRTGPPTSGILALALSGTSGGCKEDGVVLEVSRWDTPSSGWR